MTKCWYKHMYEMIYQSLTVWQFFWHNHRTYFIMGYFIRKLLTINKAKSLGTEEFFFSIFSNGYQQEKKITPLVERLFFFDALWWICHDWTSEYITEHQNIYHMLCISDQTCICMAQLFTGIHWLNCKQSYQYSQIPLYQNHE